MCVSYGRPITSGATLILRPSGVSKACITGSAFLAALVQTAVFLPMFLFVLPAGVLADTTDRRRLMPGALTVQALVVALLACLPRPVGRDTLHRAFPRHPLADYLHQRARLTLADQPLEARLLTHLRPGQAPQIRHYIAKR